MQDLLDNRTTAATPKAAPPGFNKEPSNTSPKSVGFPPGFDQQNKFAIKGRKIHSFHVDPTSPKIDEDFYQVLDEDDDYGEYERELHRRQLEYEAELTESLRASPGQLKKSKSHTSLSQISSSASEERFVPPHMRSSTSSLPNLPKGKGLSSSKSEGNVKEAANKLKKSQSMTSVYSALEENRLDLKFPELNQMAGQIYQLSKYQQGCRFLQKKLEEDIKNTGVILQELYDHLLELMTDPFGNYLFTKLVEYCDTTQRESLLKRIVPDISTAAFDMYGTQSLQKILPLLEENQIDMLIDALKTHSLALIKHNKANYLIQYCLDKLTEKHNQWIYDAVCLNMAEISKDRVGCVIVKRCIDHANDRQSTTLLEKIAESSMLLVEDPFGNYVVQHVLAKYPVHDKSRSLIRSLLGHVTELCTQKFSSNVIEKCLKVADEDTKNMMLAELTETDILPQLLNDRFANFVIQTALDVAGTEERSALVKNILPHLGKHYSPYTKRLQKKILQV